MKKTTLILDTDIGDDIDDAFALALLLHTPLMEIAGVTTVFRNTPKRAQLAYELGAAAGANLPVYAGERTPIAEPFHPFPFDGAEPAEQSVPCQWSEEYAGRPYKEGGAAYLARSAEKYGKDLTILAIGPLTNLARAAQLAPAAMKNVGRIVLMGGSFFEHKPEWNILCDPEAAQAVFSCGAPVYAVGLDVTMRCPLEGDLLQAFATSEKPVNRLLTRWLERWFAAFRFEKSVMHDPLAAASCFAQVCTFAKKYVKCDEAMRGAVLVRDAPEAGYFPVHVAETVNAGAFYALLRERLL